MSFYIKINWMFCLLLLLFTCLGCKKFLEAKPDQQLIVPETVQDLQMLLNTWYLINEQDPYAGIISADNYYLKNDDWAVQSEFERRMYAWEPKNLFSAGPNNDWGISYIKINIANTVLSHIDNIKRSERDEEEWRKTKGEALFLRARMYLQLISIWAEAYDNATSVSDLGVPLRLDPDFNIPSKRSTVKEVYDRIILDFQNSVDLLPTIPIHVLKPSKVAAYGMLARTFLFMREYKKAKFYADSTLNIKSTIIDYNEEIPGFFNPDVEYPFAQFNPEVIFSSNISVPSSIYMGYVDSLLYDSYNNNDLRKTLFFFTSSPVQLFKGNYEGANGLFNGISTAEMLLIRAEGFAREGNIESAISELNNLLEKRWVRGKFVPFLADDHNEVLDLILMERRKELVFRGLRWMDIKRLNKEGYNIILRRRLNGEEHILRPNDPRYALPIPEDVISLTGMEQNPR